MKRLIPLLCAVLLLAGCKGMYPEEFLYVEPHAAPYAYQETELASVEPVEEDRVLPMRSVSYLSDIRSGIQEMIKDGWTSGSFLLDAYHGETEDLAETVRNDLESYSPKYVYNTEMELKTESTAQGLVLYVSVKPGLTNEELESVPSRLYSNALPLIYEALADHRSSFMIEITGFVETDFVAMLEKYALDHPDRIIEIPRTNVTILPDSGSIRLVVFRFQYQTDEETFRSQLEDVEPLLDGYQNMFSEFDEPDQLLETMYKLLVPSRYTDRENATVYSLLLPKEGSSRMMAAVAAYLCKQAGKDCRIVKGEREGETWYWNQLNTPTRSLYFDLHAAALSGDPPALLPAESMTGYTWDDDQYPEVIPPAPAEPDESEETEPEETQPPETEPPETEPTEEPTPDPSETP